MNLDFQITEYPEWRENKKKCNPGVKEIHKRSDMNNKVHVSTYIKTIIEETNQHPNEKHTIQIQHWMFNLNTLISIHIH